MNEKELKEQLMEKLIVAMLMSKKTHNDSFVEWVNLMEIDIFHHDPESWNILTTGFIEKNFK